VNLSDLAAKGATPAGFVLTLALREAGDAWLAPFARALGEDAALFGCPLLGGDTVSTPGPLMISITAFGHVAAGQMVRRDRARAGDCVVVTGTIGDAALGLDLLQNGRVAAVLKDDVEGRAMLAGRYRVPQPRMTLAEAVRDHARAAMDISDGLAGDLAKLCAASGVSATIDAAAIPLSAAASRVLAAGAVDFETLVAGGDDYELLCAIPEERVDAFVAAARRAGLAATAIGRITQGAGPVVFNDKAGRPIALRHLSFSHF
jgi:thiamine-monophosphate kinase